MQGSKICPHEKKLIYSNIVSEPDRRISDSEVYPLLQKVFEPDR